MSRNYEPSPTELQRMDQGEKEYQDDAWIICPACNGAGELHPSDKCPVCHGAGEIPAVKNAN